MKKIIATILFLFCFSTFAAYAKEIYSNDKNTYILINDKYNYGDKVILVSKKYNKKYYLEFFDKDCFSLNSELCVYSASVHNKQLQWTTNIYLISLQTGEKLCLGIGICPIFTIKGDEILYFKDFSAYQSKSPEMNIKEKTIVLYSISGKTQKTIYTIPQNYSIYACVDDCSPFRPDLIYCLGNEYYTIYFTDASQNENIEPQHTIVIDQKGQEFPEDYFQDKPCTYYDASLNVIKEKKIKRINDNKFIEIISENGKITESEYLNKQKNGLEKRFSNGKLFGETMYENGKQNGKSVLYSNGMIHYELILKDDKPVSSKEYYENTSIVAIACDFEKNIKFTKEYNLKGILIKEYGKLENSLNEGYYKECYDDGTVKMEGHYISGCPEGKWSYYNNKRKNTGNSSVKNGNGELREYTDDGKLTAKLKYTNCILIAKEIFGENGIIKEKILYKNGKPDETINYNSWGFEIKE